MTTAGNITSLVIGLFCQALVLFKIDARVAIFAVATIIVGVTLFLLRNISRDGQIVENRRFF